MTNTNYFWYGFLACYILMSALGMVLVYLTRVVELLRERKKLKEEEQ